MSLCEVPGLGDSHQRSVVSWDESEEESGIRGQSSAVRLATGRDVLVLRRADPFDPK